MSTSSTSSELPPEVIACLKNARYVSFYPVIYLLTAGLSDYIFSTAPFGDLRWPLASCEDNRSCFVALQQLIIRTGFPHELHLSAS